MKPSTPDEAAARTPNPGATRNRAHLGVVAVDEDALITRWDRSSEELSGWAAEEALGRKLSEFVALPDDTSAAMIQAIRDGAAWEGQVPLKRRDGSNLPSHVFISPPASTTKGFDEVIVVISVGQGDPGPQRWDAEAMREREWRLAFLAEASAALASSLNSHRTLQNLARLVIPKLGDWCAVDVVEVDGSIRRVTVTHARRGSDDLAGRLPEGYPSGGNTESGLGFTLRTGLTEFHPSVTEEDLERLAYDGEHLALLRTLGVRSVMWVPMTIRGRTLGAITLAATDSGRVYGPEDRTLVEELGRRAAGAMDNARLYEERSYIARTLQRSLLPPRLPDIPGIEVAARYRAAGEGNEVGGDFYDLFQVGRRAWAVVIGDVCGKGADAAAITGLARHTLRVAASREWRPRRVLVLLNEALLRDHGDQYCTAVLARIEWAGSRVRATIACGGHPPPLLVRADGRVESVGQPGTLLGVFPDPELATAVLDLRRGDALLFYTDGVTETRGPGLGLSESELRDLLGSHAGISAERLADAVEKAAVSSHPGGTRDDIALICLRVVP